MNKINILEFVHSFIHGGTERQFYEVVRRLDPEKFNIHIACYHNAGPFAELLRQEGFFIKEFPIKRFYDLQALRQFYNLVRYLIDEKIDIVHSHEFYSNVFCMAAARLAGTKVIVTSRRETPVSEKSLKINLQEAFKSIIYRYSHKVIVNAGAIKKVLLGNNVDNNKIEVVYNGLDLERFSSHDPTFSRNDKLKELGIRDGNKVVSMVAQLRPEKDHRCFLKAAAGIIKKEQNTSFLVIGKGPLRKELEIFTRELGINESVKFLGDRSDVLDILKCTDIFVLSCNSGEGLSNAVMEAMAMSLPVVATDVGGNRELIDDCKTGFLVRAEDPDAMAEKVMRLIDDKSMRLGMGANAHKKILNEFTIERTVKRFEEFYYAAESEFIRPEVR